MTQPLGALVDEMPPLPHINDVHPRSDRDDALFGELREVLARHGALSRFGITLLHHHFDVSVDEVMLEVVDEKARIESASPVTRTDASLASSVETSWRLDAPSGMRFCERQCARPYGPNGPHMPQHFRTG
jgi:hypothetical protein